MVDKLYIEYMPLSDLITRLDPQNPKEHDLGALHNSMNAFGYIEVPVLNEKTGLLVAGHGRIETLVQKKSMNMPAPQNIEVKEDDWYVPVQRGISFKNKKQALAYLVASNRLTMLGGWNEPFLLDALKALDPDLLLATGFNGDDIESIFRNLSGDYQVDYKSEWQGMPEFNNEENPCFHIIKVAFETQADLEAFAKLVEQTVTNKTTQIYYPHKPRKNEKAYVSEHES